MLDEYYLLLITGTFVFTYIMSRFMKVKLDLLSYFKAVFLVSLPFIIWDSWAVSQGHWDFNPDFTMGWYIGNLAVEEILFFIAVPYAMTVIYEFGKRYVKGEVSDNFLRFAWTVLALINVTFLVASDVGTYTFVNSVAFFIAILLFLTKFRTLSKTIWFWQFQLILYGLFLIFNTVLTAPPVIEYGAGEYTGFRVGTIPIEDFFYNFTLANLFIAVYLLNKRTARTL